MSSSGDFELSAELNRIVPVYALGETISVSVSVNTTASMTVFNVNADSELTKVFPSEQNVPGILIEPGVLTSVPPPGATMTVTEPAGKNTLRIVAVTETDTNEPRGLNINQMAAGSRVELNVCFEIVRDPLLDY